MWPIFVSPGLLLHVIKPLFIANRLVLPTGNFTFDFLRERNSRNALVINDAGTGRIRSYSCFEPCSPVTTGRGAG